MVKDLQRGKNTTCLFCCTVYFLL